MDYKEARAEAIANFESFFIIGLMNECCGNVSLAARTANLDRVYLHRLLKRHNIEAAAYRPAFASEDPNV